MNKHVNKVRKGTGIAEAITAGRQQNKQRYLIIQLEFGMYPQSMPTEWTHVRTLRPWQSVRLKKKL